MRGGRGRLLRGCGRSCEQGVRHVVERKDLHTKQEEPLLTLQNCKGYDQPCF